MKKVLFFIISILIISIGTLLGYKYYNHNHKNIKHPKDINYQELSRTLSFISNKEKKDIKKDDKEKYQQLKIKNDRLKNFDMKLLINPSAIKTINKYEPEKFDVRTWGDKYMTKNLKESLNPFISPIIKDDLLSLLKDAKKSGIDLRINSAFRSYKNQEEVYKKTPDIASLPGESEHQSGLAVDLSQEKYKIFLKSPAYKYLLDNAYKYGFILSFPKDQQYNSGQNFEAWHWRYIGKEYSLLYNEMNTNHNLTLTNFIEKKFVNEYLVNSKDNYPNISSLNNKYHISNIKITKNNTTIFDKNSNEQIVSSLFTNLKVFNNLKIKNESLEKDEIENNEELETNKKYSPLEISKYTFNNNYYSFVNKYLKNNVIKDNNCTFNSLNYYFGSLNKCNINALNDLNSQKVYKQNIFNMDNITTSFLQYSNDNLSSYVELNSGYKIIFNVKNTKNDVHNLLKYRQYIHSLINILNNNLK